MSDYSCSGCGAMVTAGDGVSVRYETGTKFLCSRCYNESVAEGRGLDYEHIDFAPLTFQDIDGDSHTFRFKTHIFSDHLSLTAVEDSVIEGYEFSVVADAEQDLFLTFQLLYERIRQALGRRHIEFVDDGYQIARDDVVRGHITEESDSVAQVPRLIIDGKVISWDEMGRMLAPYSGFHFKLEIFDRGEEP